MSAIGPKQTWTSAPHMSAFGGKADITFFESPLSRSLSGAKRTSPTPCRWVSHYAALLTDSRGTLSKLFASLFGFSDHCVKMLSGFSWSYTA
jgi:hypothetical protein